MKYKTNRKGVTLIELLLALGLIGILTQIVFSIYFVSNDSFTISTNKGFSQKSVRLASDFIVSELKFADSIILQEDFDINNMFSSYYKLELEGDDDGTYNLIRTKYNKDGTESSKKLINGKWDNVRLVNSTPGSIDLIINQSEGSSKTRSGFELESEVRLINSPLFSNNMDIVLDGSTVLYYTLPKDTAVVSIDIPVEIPANNEPNDESPDDPEDSENPDDNNSPFKLSLDLEKVEQKNGDSYITLSPNPDNVYSIKKGTEFRITTKIRNGTGDFTVKVEQYSTNISDDKRTVTVKGISHNGEGKTFDVTINVTDDSYMDKPKESKIISFKTFNK